MSRHARSKSESGFYHVILRGIGKQILFEDDSDCLRFLGTLEKYLKEYAVEVHAYCLMENHVHMLLRDPQDELSAFMKRLEGSYAFYFNQRYERVGTLFQERFKSEAVGDDAYFATVLRYILQNPQKAGVCATCEYPWSSYQAMADAAGGDAGIVETGFARGLFGGREEMLRFILAANEDLCMEPAPARIGDEAAKRIVRERLGVDSGTQLQSYDKDARDDALRALKASGLSVRQIERLTGINRGVVQKA